MEENQNGQNQTIAFKNSDKYFYKANLLFIILISVYGAVLLASAIIMMVYNNILGGIIALATAAVTIAIAFIIFKLFMSMLADIKFIRNKLYDNENDNVNISNGIDKV